MPLALKSDDTAEVQQPTLSTWVLPYVATLLAMFCLQASNLGFSPLLPSIQKEFDQNFSSMGLFKGMYGLISIFVSVPAGLIIKYYGEKRVLLGGMIVTALGLVALSQAANFGMALTARAGWLVGYRFAFICVMTAIALTCPRQVRGRCMGILGAMAALSSVIGAPFGAAIDKDFGWRDSVLAFAGIAVFGAVLFGLLYRKTNGHTKPPVPASQPPKSGRSHSDPPDRNSGTNDTPQPKPHGSANAVSPYAAFVNPLVWAIAFLTALSGVASLTANFYIPYAADQTYGSKGSAPQIISNAFMVAVIVNLLFGFLMDRFHKWRVMAGLSLISIAGCLMMTSSELSIFWIGSVLVLAFGHAAIQQSYSIATEILHGRETGNVMGIVSGVSGVVGYLTPQALGILRDKTGGFTAGWFTLAALASVTLILVLVLWHRSVLVSARSEVADPGGTS